MSEEREESLHEAIVDGDEEAVRRLLAAGADPNEPDEEGVVPLLLTLEEDEAGIAEALLEAGARWPRGAGYLQALAEQAPRVGAVLVRRGVVPAEADLGEGDTLLSEAAMEGAAPLVEALLEAGADPNRPGEFGIPPLVVAAQEGHAEVVEMLLRAGADPNGRDEEGHTALHCLEGDEAARMARALLEAGADPTLRDEEGAAPAETLQELLPEAPWLAEAADLLQRAEQERAKGG